MAPFNRSHMSSYWRSIVTGHILYHFRDKTRYWSKIAVFIPHLQYSTPLVGGRIIILPIRFGTKRLDWRGYPMGKKFDDMFSRFDTIPAYNGRTDRQTDRYLVTVTLSRKRYIVIVVVVVGHLVACCP